MNEMELVELMRLLEFSDNDDEGSAASGICAC